MTPKKILLLGLAALTISVFARFPAGAAEMVGIVDPQKMLFQHPEFDSVAKHIVELSRQKGSEIRFTLEKETDPERRVEILDAANQEMTGAEERLMLPLHEDCRHALAAVMEKKEITIVLKKDAVYHGGTDVTEDVIAQLKKIFKSR